MPYLARQEVKRETKHSNPLPLTMKNILSLSAAFAVFAMSSAAPLVELETKPMVELRHSPIEKQQIGGLSSPSALASTLNTASGPINYGNLNLGTGMQPSQVVHYGIENQPSHGFIAPMVATTTAKEAMFQLAHVDKAEGPVVNADLEVGKLILKGDVSKYAGASSESFNDNDTNDDENVDVAEWGRYGWGHRQPYWWYRHGDWHRRRPYRRIPPWWYRRGNPMAA
ncbi:hypothetical protein BX616_007922 [Lobosporangium transversale]|uniref:Uncharacterized protein n=1 Tax=Lobosporangium transversale TaxID=64571 RepID=A0A1Y2H2Z4_9FUNG|nr:hypothetical protein BCR41DRAFT_366613 [Lobosporangium transversale]KAF9914611.1 hypothetical protein BX616_007922 [Lobosporangium transversale]ORZ28927.1 hypothetical protein BCR41DRAFT_366613 [Lobosporangium transversale]|eukprot:XP_021886600.1 hypothetical protein BCR41DRAFT_366613 [Lobosporangium transversale]